MLKVALRWILPTAGVLVIGPIVGRMMPEFTAGGAPALLAAVVFGLITARLCGVQSALYAGGLTLLSAAWVSAGLEDMFRSGPPGTLLGVMAADGAVLTGASVVFVVLASKFGKQHDGRLTDADLIQDLRRSVTTPAGWLAIVVGAAACLAVVWLVARDFHRGQALFAAVAGGAAAGTVGWMVATGLDKTPPIMSGFLAVVLAAIIAPLVGFVMPGASEIPKGVVAGDLPGMLRMLPLDWAAGLILGVPPGLAWAGAVHHTAVEKHEQTAAA